MPRSYTTSFRKEAEAILSPEADLCFLTISHGQLSEPVRVVWDTKDYIYGGKTFIGFPFDIQIFSDDEGPPKAQLAIQNVDSRIGETIRILQTPPRLKLQVLSTLDFNIAVDPRTEIGTANVIYSFDKAFLINCKIDYLTVSADIVGYGYLQRVWPGKRATQTLFPGLFR
jgi:Domain of unknown function (DUF1833)